MSIFDYFGKGELSNSYKYLDFRRGKPYNWFGSSDSYRPSWFGSPSSTSSPKPSWFGSTSSPKPSWLSSPSYNTDKPSWSSSRTSDMGSSGSMLGRILVYLVALIIIVFVILVFIDRFFTPIFKSRPGDPGIIPVPWSDDGVLYWNKGTTGQILNKDLPISNLSSNYSLILDIFIQNPLQFSKYPRVLFSRGATFRNTRIGDTLLGVMNNYNFAIALLPDTNDLICSVLNKDDNMEISLISNVPVQQPFRVGIIIMEMAMEVYLNGKLVNTRVFLNAPKNVVGDIYPASGIEINIAKMRNLKIWSKVITASNIREALPQISVSSDFVAAPMTTSSTCGLPDMPSLSSLSSSLPDMSNMTDSLSDSLSDVSNSLSNFKTP